jgi:hypothetical protein
MTPSVADELGVVAAFSKDSHSFLPILLKPEELSVDCRHAPCHDCCTKAQDDAYHSPARRSVNGTIAAKRIAAK